MTHDLTRFLADPKPGITLDELAYELNELAKIRESTRLAFSLRLAAAFLMIVGHPPRRCNTGVAPFYSWCSVNIRSAKGKRYTYASLRSYVREGFANNPERFVRDRVKRVTVLRQENIDIGRAVRRAITADDPPQAIPITKLKEQGIATDVATEVNVLMTAWERASSQARSQFMYIVTGKRIAA